MSVKSLSDSTKLDDVPKAKVLLDGRLGRPLEQIREARVMTDQLGNLCNDLDQDIKRMTKFTDQKIKYLEDVQNASIRYWKVIGSTLAVLVGLKLMKDGWTIWSWFRNQQKKGGDAIRNKKNEIVSSKPREHPRDWRIYN
jgi:hypothetical protein